MANNALKNATLARTIKLLEKKYKVGSQILNTQQIIDARMGRGDEFFIDLELDTNETRKLTERKQFLSKKWIFARTEDDQRHGIGSNYNLPEVKEYWSIETILRAGGVFKPVYLLGNKNEGTGWEIPKLVYDFYTTKKAA